MKSKAKLPKGHSEKHFAMNGWQGALGVSFPWHIPAWEHAWNICRVKIQEYFTWTTPSCLHTSPQQPAVWMGRVPAFPGIWGMKGNISRTVCGSPLSFPGIPSTFSWRKSKLARGLSVPRCPGDEDEPLIWAHPLPGGWADAEVGGLLLLQEGLGAAGENQGGTFGTGTGLSWITSPPMNTGQVPARRIWAIRAPFVNLSPD